MSWSPSCFGGIGPFAILLSHLPLVNTFHLFHCSRAVHDALISLEHDGLIWRTAYSTAWPFIRFPPTAVLPFSAPTWRGLLAHHGQLYAEMRLYWTDFHRRIPAEKFVDLPKARTAQQIVEWQQQRQKLLPVDFAFNLMACAGTEERTDGQAHNVESSGRRHNKERDCNWAGDFWLALSTMQCSTIDEVLGEAVFYPSSLSQLLSPTRSEQFVQLYSYSDHNYGVVVMQVIDQHQQQDESASTEPSSPPASAPILRTSKRQKRPVSSLPVPTTAQSVPFPTTYDSFRCACLHARCSCVYSRLHGVMFSGLASNRYYELRAVHWLDLIRQQQRLGRRLSGAELYGVWSEWHSEAFQGKQYWYRK